VPLPDVRGRSHILKVHMRKVPAADNVDSMVIARGTPGFSGADLANLVNEAALFGARAGKRLVEMDEFEKAKDKIMMGAERKTMVISEKEKRNTAYHEAGHTIVGRLMPEHDPVYKVTIIPRGRALGVTMFLPEEDRYSISRQGLVSQICSLYGGRIAEEMTLGIDGVTTGASNDIERASSLARSMVTKWGFSAKLGPLQYDVDDHEVFLGKSAGTQTKTVSDDTANLIDSEVRDIIDSCYQKATKMLQENIDKLHTMADALMEYETLDSNQIDDIMAGAKPRSPDDTPKPTGKVDTSEKDANEGSIGGPAGEH
jgi:cell division protease FtsH